MVGNLSKRRHSQYFAAIAVAVGAMAFGTARTWSSEYGPQKINDFKPTDGQIHWANSTLTFASGSMCVVTGYFTNFIGRKPAMLLLVFPFTLGWTLIVFAKDISMLIAGRALLGFSSGGICVIVPMYIGEIADNDNRGVLGSLFQILFTVGTLYVKLLSGLMTTTQLSVMCASIPLIFGVLVVFCPESPTYLMQKNRPVDAAKALARLRGKGCDPVVELSEIPVVPKQQLKETIRSMLRQSSVKGLSISYGLFICQQMCGINILALYTTQIFQIAKIPLNPEDPNTKCGISTSLLGVFAALLAGIVVDRFDRRNLLLTSQLVVTICTFLLGGFFYLKKAGDDRLGWIPLSLLCLFVIGFSIGLGPIPWVMLSELFAPDVKGLAMSISTSSSLTLAFIVTKTHDNVEDVFGISGTFWLCTGFSLLGIVFVYYAVPETKGKSLNSIQQMLYEGHHVPINSREANGKPLEGAGLNVEMKPLKNANKLRKRFTF